MASNLFRTSVFVTGAFFLFILGTSVSQAHQQPTACEGQSGKALGLCRAAVASGCSSASENSNSRGNHFGHSRRHHGHSRYCDQLSSNYARLTGLDPAWETPVTIELEPVVDTTTTDTTTTTTDGSTTTDVVGPTIDTGGFITTF